MAEKRLGNPAYLETNSLCTHFRSHGFWKPAALQLAAPEMSQNRWISIPVSGGRRNT